MSALPALTPLRIVPITKVRLRPAPLPGEPFEEDEDDSRFVQDSFSFDDVDHPGTPAPPAQPDPHTVAGPLAQALVEVLAGRRPVVQLVRWTTPQVYAALSARATVAHRRRLTATGTTVRVSVRRVLVSRPRDDVAEVSIVVIDGSRVRAIAMQLRSSGGRWSIGALQVG